jgi:hypothetical protein
MKDVFSLLRTAVFGSLILIAFASIVPVYAQSQLPVQLYRYKRFGPPTGTVDYYFYTTDPNEGAQFGFQDTVAGYIYPYQAPNTVPFYRFRKSISPYPNLYFYSTNYSEGINAGYTFEVITGYVFPISGYPGASNLPFTRLHSQTGGFLAGYPLRHFYTTSQSEINRYTAPDEDNGGRGDWVLDATACYLVSSIDDVPFFVHQQYLDILGRVPDGAWEAWISFINECGGDAQCINSRRISTVRGFIESVEFKQSHPILFNSPGTQEYNEEYVRQLYLCLLRREPDGAYYAWLDIINSGGDYDGLVGGFINSIEYRARFR